MISIPQAIIRYIKSLNLDAKFDNKTVTKVATFCYVELFKQVIGFKDLLRKGVAYKKSKNSLFSTVEIIDYLIDANILGYSRFSHLGDLANDVGYKKIKEVDRLPSEKVCKDILKSLPQEALLELRNINKQILELKSKTEGAREVCINIDDTVITIFGNQEGAGIGYNPRYKGRPSFKEKIAAIAGTDELLDITLESGTHHSNHEFLDFFQNCVKQLPKGYILKRVRLDRGFIDEKNLKFFEEEQLEYVVKCKKYASVKKIIEYINENQFDYEWISISSKYAVSEITVPLSTWERARRFVIVRKEVESKDEDQLRLEEFTYQYEVIVTNIDYLTAEDIFHEYNKRCDVENNIDELKQGFAFGENSLIQKKMNELYLLIKMIAYNIHNWFKQAILPKEMHHHEITTLRRIFYKVAGNICGNNSYRHLKFSNNHFLEKVIQAMKSNIDKFINKVPHYSIL